MTPFEYAVLSLFLLFSVTNVAKLSESPRLFELSKPFLWTVLACIAIAVFSILNLAINLIFGA